MMKSLKSFNCFALPSLLIFSIMLMGGCASTNTSSSATADAGSDNGRKGRKAKQEEVYSPVGTWEYSVETPDGGGAGTMKISGAPGTFEVLLQTDQFGELRVYDLNMTGESMAGKIDVAGMTAEVEGDFDGDNFSGAVILGDEAYPLEATRISKGQ